jgi:deoxyribodipyrimidine photo-lyase
MLAASFLTKHLLQPWQDGEAWFWDNLVDADPAANPVNWQWVAGCGTDAAPYFRVFNPELQAAKADPDGAYVARWAPERTAPIVDLATARKAALAAYRAGR